MADTIKIKDGVTLQRQANLGEDVEGVEFAAGSELAVLQEWDNSWLAKSDEGHLYNVKKELAEEA